ncbi:MAG: ABC transporter permease, partial [Actinomycetota bacterium]|nr:ABC transporter permease [Actinomycetota bacterium]
MKDLLPFVVIGVASGSLFGLAAVGLVLTFKATGVFNLAHGAIAAVAAYAFYDLHEDAGIPWPLALVVTVVIVGVVGGLVVDVVAGAVGQARPILAIVATVGLLLAIQGGLTVRYGAASLTFDGYLPRGSVELAGVDVTYEQLLVSAAGLVAVALLVVYFRFSRTGLAMRAVVDDPALLALAATPPRRVRMTAWVIGSSFAALTGVLIGPSIGRDPSRLTLLVIQAFGAAAIGRFSSLPWTYVGGLVIGVSASVATHLVADHPGLAGLPTSVPFLVLFIVLLVTPAGSLAVRTATTRARASRVGKRWSLPMRSGVIVAIGLGAALVPQLVDAKLPVYLNAAVLTPMLLSIGLLTWTSNQISLCHAAFVAVGATSFAHLSDAGLPWVPALALGALAAVPLGAFVAVPAIRLSGVYLALATFGFGLVVQRLLYPAGVMFGGLGFRSAPRPDLWFIDGQSDRWYFGVVVAIAALCAAAVAALQRSRLGRILRAVGDSPTALSSLGADANVARLLVFCVSAFLAALTGGLSIAATTQASVDTFGLFESLLWLSVLVICGSNVLIGAPLAALLLAVLPSYLPDALVDWQPVGFGIAALLVAALLDRTFGLGRRSAGRDRRSPVRSR